MQNNSSLSKACWYILISIVLLFVVIIGVACIFFANRKEKEINKYENGGKVVLNYASDFPGITISNMLPVSDESQLLPPGSENRFEFFVDTQLDDAPQIIYDIVVSFDNNKTTVSPNEIKIYLEKEDSGSYIPAIGPTLFSEDANFVEKVLYTKKVKKNGIDRYRLSVWLQEHSQQAGSDCTLTVKLKTKEV